MPKKMAWASVLEEGQAAILRVSNSTIVRPVPKASGLGGVLGVGKCQKSNQKKN